MAIKIMKAVRARIEAGSLEEIRRQVLAIAKEAETGKNVKVEIVLSHGVHRPMAPIVFSTKENPELANISLHICRRPGTAPIVATMNEVVGAKFSPVDEKPYYAYRYEKGENGKYPVFHDYFCNGKRLKMATSPAWRNPFPLRDQEKPLEGLYAPIDIAKEIKKAGIGSAELRIYGQGAYCILRVKDVDLSATKEKKGETYALVTFFEEFDTHFAKWASAVSKPEECEMAFANTLAFLTEADTYAYDAHTGTVCLVPDTVGSFRDKNLGYAMLSSYFVFEGMKNVTVEGLRFQGISSSYVCENSYFGLPSHDEMRVGRLREAAIVARNVRNFKVSDCVFRFLGTNGVQLCDDVARGAVESCRFEDVAMSAITAGNDTVDGGASEDRLFHINIVNNEIEGAGKDYPNAPAIFLGRTDVSRISHNSVLGFGGFGIFAGQGASAVQYVRGESVNLRDCEISYNEICGSAEVCGDGAAVYVTGGNGTKESARRCNVIHHNYVAFDESAAEGGRGYCLDGAASHFHVYENVAEGCALPLLTRHDVAERSAYCCTIENLYATVGADPAQHMPDKDVICQSMVAEASAAELFQKHPKAKAISESAGYRARLR